MTNFILLTGAGFSRNWGGWLGKEVFEYLLSCPEIYNDPHLKDVLWQNKDSGFETALEKIQSEFLSDPQTPEKSQRLDAFNKALTGMFENMQKGFEKITNGLEFISDLNTNKTKNFLARFQAVFTLNQDLLLETHYHPLSHTPAPSIPGMVKIQNIPSGDWHVESDRKVAKGTQPYFKLHGSYKWSNPRSQKMLIMGGYKTQQIAGQELLSWYMKEFDSSLSQGNDTRLMIIGYSFSDEHINALLLNGVKNGLRLFIIDPCGSDIAIKKCPYLQPAIMGASRRALSSTLLNGNGADTVEYMKVMKFFS